MLSHVPLEIPKLGSDEFDTFCSNLSLFLSNINYLNHTFQIVTDDFNTETSTWWSSDEETFEGRAIHSLTTSAGGSRI